MSSLPEDEIAEVEEAVAVQYIGLPLALKALSERQLQEFLLSALRKGKEDESPDSERQSPNGD